MRQPEEGSESDREKSQRGSREKDQRRSTLKAQKTCSQGKEKQRQVPTDRNIERGRENSFRTVPIGMADGLIKKKNETRVIRKLEEKWWGMS